MTQSTASSSEESASAAEQMTAQAAHLRGFVGELQDLVGGRDGHAERAAAPRVARSRAPAPRRPAPAARPTTLRRPATAGGADTPPVDDDFFAELGNADADDDAVVRSF